MQAKSAMRAKRMVMDFILFGGFRFPVDSKNDLELSGVRVAGDNFWGIGSVYIDGLRTILRARQDEGVLRVVDVDKEQSANHA